MTRQTQSQFRKTSVLLSASLLALLLCLCGAGVTWASSRNTQDGMTPEEAIRYANGLSIAFEHTADVIQPSVVTIKAVKHFQPAQHWERRELPSPGSAVPWPFNDDLLRRFFNEGIPREMVPQQGMGSGVIVDANGYILTNNHVVAGADEVTVTLANGRGLHAKVIGTDPMSDLAVVQVNEKGLQAAKLGDSDALRVGEWVLAAGNPFGLRDTVTAGIVSAKGRSNVRIAEYEDFIQTDAAVNPGNSGGPLVDLEGNVVGINTAIASHNGGNNGVGFAIPINMAKSIMDSLIHKGQVVRGWLGIAIQPLDETMARSFGYDSTKGALVGDVFPDGPARDAGLKPGDIIVRFGDTQTDDPNQLRNLAAATEPGTKVAVELIREGKPLTVHIMVTQREGMPVAAGETDVSNDLGLTVEDLTADQARSLGINRDVQGVVVTQVDPNGIAYLAGMQPGNVIVDVHGTPVHNTREFQHELATHDLKSGVRLAVQAGDNRLFVMLQKQED
ncbi:MAG: DegQ family serine endoprotease [Phycisphaerae bacterium]|nr:DegQ family serine endoprotease [Phycisphaerae bacterium]